MPRSFVAIGLFGALLVASMLLAIDGYQNISNFNGWCISIIPSEHALSFTNSCNTEYLAALIAGTIAASVATLGLIETTTGQFDFLPLETLREELARWSKILGLLGFAFLFIFFVPFCS